MRRMHYKELSFLTETMPSLKQLPTIPDGYVWKKTQIGWWLLAKHSSDGDGSVEILAECAALPDDRFYLGLCTEVEGFAFDADECDLAVPVVLAQLKLGVYR